MKNDSDLKALILQNTKILHALHDWLRDPALSGHDRAAAVTHHFQQYELLAFPGGLSNVLLSLKANERVAIVSAIAFLEADPTFYRSGYIKADLLHSLKRATLTSGEIARLQKVILFKIADRDSREFRYYARLAGYVSDQCFTASVERLIIATEPAISRRAKWVLHAIKQIQRSNHHAGIRKQT